jgi:hypothetical protein
VTAYSIYSQLPSVSGGLPSIRNLRTRHAVVTRDPPNVESIWLRPQNRLPALVYLDDDDVVVVDINRASEIIRI